MSNDDEFGNLGPLIEAAAGNPLAKGIAKKGRPFANLQNEINAAINAKELASRFKLQIEREFER